MPRSRLLAAAAVATVLVIPAAAQAPQLDVRLGLWEVTTVTNLGGAPPAMDTSKMTPEQQARMNDAMKQMMGEHRNTENSCITQDDLNKANFMPAEADAQNCRQTVTLNTKTALESSFTCTGGQPMTGKMHIEAPTPTAMNATMDMSAGQSGRAMTMTIKMTGKWLKAECGDVK
jgi:hypothetical protein